MKERERRTDRVGNKRKRNSKRKGIEKARIKSVRKIK